MPIRRRGDGQIEEESTEAVPEKRSSGASQARTGRVASRGGRGDSLFEPKGGGEGGARHLEERTVLMDAGRGADDDTRIVPPRRRGSKSGTAAADQPGLPDSMRDPPVGWLVVVRGPGKGNALTLGNGMNVIGRGADARVRVDFGDDTISSVNHARLAYEPRQRRYVLSHGDGSNLTYLNGELVMDAVEVSSGAMIEMGETTLRFQAFCSQDFDWPDVDD